MLKPRHYTESDYKDDLFDSRQRVGWSEPLCITADVSIFSELSGQHFDRRALPVFGQSGGSNDGEGYYVIWEGQAHLLGVSGGYRMIVTSDPALRCADGGDAAFDLIDNEVSAMSELFQNQLRDRISLVKFNIGRAHNKPSRAYAEWCYWAAYFFITGAFAQAGRIYSPEDINAYLESKGALYIVQD